MGMLDGKVAIITGGTSGIGAACVELFIAEGAQVVIAARRQVEGEELARRHGQAASFIRTDVAQEADVQAMVAHCLSQFGRFDCLGRVEDGRGGLGHSASPRFPSPLIERSMRISRTTLSDWLHRKAHDEARVRSRMSGGRRLRLAAELLPTAPGTSGVCRLSPITMPSPSSEAHQKSGSFPPPALPGLSSVGSEEARLIALALASVRRSNWTCSFPASSFHEDVFL